MKKISLVYIFEEVLSLLMFKRSKPYLNFDLRKRLYTANSLHISELVYRHRMKVPI